MQCNAMQCNCSHIYLSFHPPNLRASTLHPDPLPTLFSSYTNPIHPNALVYLVYLIYLIYSLLL